MRIDKRLVLCIKLRNRRGLPGNASEAVSTAAGASLSLKSCFPGTARGASIVLKLKGRTAVVTGAAGGIGRAIAVSLARRSCHLALVDIDDAALARTAAEIRGNHAPDGFRISWHHLDVSDRAAVSALPKQVTAEHGGVDVVVNNAGVALGGTFLEVADSDFDWLFGINFWGVVQMTRAFLPLLQKSAEARLVNISSLFGLIAPPGQTAYCASKFAVRGFSEALRHELAGTRIGVTVVHPGGIATSIAKNARLPSNLSEEELAKRRKFFDSFLTMPPEIAGEIIVRGVENRKPRILVGRDAKYAAIVERLMPVTYWNWLGQGAKQ
jgi:NAD(P)-dependent dehydrogenase (short-subunit alcohol dehydrogenase family)